MLLWYHFILCILITLCSGARITVNPNDTDWQSIIANATDGDEIVFTNGIYSGSNRNLLLYGRTLTFRSESGNAGDVIIDCELGKTAFIVQPAPAQPLNLATSLSFSGLTIKNGYAQQAGGVFLIAPNNATNSVFINISNCTLTDNDAFTGGVIYAIKGKGPLSIIIINSIFRANSGGIGGVLCSIGATVMIVNSAFFTNIVLYEGGALYLHDSTTGIQNSNFSSNRGGPAGGAISSHSGSLYITNTAFQNNTARVAGGAITLNSPQDATIKSSVFKGNQAYYAGAILFTGVGMSTIENGILERNYATDSGGAMDIDQGASVSVISSFISSNTAELVGGGVIVVNGSISLQNTTTSNNVAEYGGGFGAKHGASITLSFCNVSDNLGTVHGDSIFCNDSSSLVIHETIVTPHFDNRTTEKNGVFCGRKCSIDVGGNRSGDWDGVCGISGSKDKKMAGWKVAITVIFVIICAAFIVGGIFYFVKRKKTSFEKMGQ